MRLTSITESISSRLCRIDSSTASKMVIRIDLPDTDSQQVFCSVKESGLQAAQSNLVLLRVTEIAIVVAAAIRTVQMNLFSSKNTTQISFFNYGLLICNTITLTTSSLCSVLQTKFLQHCADQIFIVCLAIVLLPSSFSSCFFFSTNRAVRGSPRNPSLIVRDTLQRRPQ